MRIRKWVLPTLLLCIVGLTACNTSQETHPAASSTGNTSNSDTSNLKSNQAGQSSNAISEQGNTSSSPADSQSANSNGTDTNSNAVDNIPTRGYINTIKQLASQGKVINCEFAADTSLMDVIEKKWGKPDKIDTAGQGMYATYSQRGIAFGFNKGAQVFDVRSYDNKLKQITYMDVERVLGKPVDIRHYNDQDILVYNTGDKFQLEWIFSTPDKQEANPSLDHISVFCPKDASN